MKKTIKKAFYPSRENNHHPLFWKPLSVFLFSAITLALAFCVAFQSADIENPDSLLGNIKTGVVIALTNTERSDNNLKELVESESLAAAAQLKADDMAAKGYFSHNTPEGLTPWHWFTKAGYEYEKAGENLAVNFDDSEDVVRAWMNSPGHRANIVKEGYTEIGVATAEGTYKGKDATFVVQLFGKPKTSPAPYFAAVQKIATVGPNQEVSVQGAEITRYEFSEIGDLVLSEQALSLVMLFFFSFVITISIIVMLLKRRLHKKEIIFSCIGLLTVLGISVYVQVHYFKTFAILLN